MSLIVNSNLTVRGDLIVNNNANVEFLLLAGGGGGTLNNACHAGAGAGGLLIGTLSLPKGTYTITIGAGGAGYPSNVSAALPGRSGNTSSISGSSIFVMTKGGGPGGESVQSYPNFIAGSTGGWDVFSASFAGNTWSDIDQGKRGGRGCSSFAGGGGCSMRLAGGGGGAGTDGASGGTITNRAGNGGDGKLSSINGTPTYYGGGGGGNAYPGGTGGTGGLGGGGNGGTGSSSTGTNGGTNTGGGGGGSAGATSATASGGSGIAIIRYSGSTQIMTGGTVSFITGYVVHTFTGTGTLTYS